jgi:hypothetical protein
MNVISAAGYDEDDIAEALSDVAPNLGEPG